MGRLTRPPPNLHGLPGLEPPKNTQNWRRGLLPPLQAQEATSHFAYLQLFRVANYPSKDLGSWLSRVLGAEPIPSGNIPELVGLNV